MSAVSYTHRARPGGAASDETAADDFSYDAFISYSGFRKPGEASQFDRKVAERCTALWKPTVCHAHS